MQFKLPELGEGVHEGELVKWRVKPGDNVKYDQPLCEIMTDKATVEIPSAFQGKVAELNAKEGETVHVGQLMCTFEGAAGAQAQPPAGASVSPAPHAPAAAPAAKAPTAPAPAMHAAPSGGNGHGASMGAGMTAVSAGNLDIATRALAAPAARKLAREQGVDLAAVPATGPHGRIMKEDLERFISGGARATMAARAGRPAMPMGPMVQEERVPFKGLRKKIAEKMALSKSKAAHFTYVEEADATELVKLRNSAKEIGTAQGIKVTYLPFIMKAMVACLRKYPILNSSLDEERGELVYKHFYNIGLSIQTEDGLTAPCVKNVESKSILELAKEIQDIVDRARNKKLTREDFEGSTITLTNAGSIGGLFATPVINYPEVAILGFNKIFRKPVAMKIGGTEQVVVRDWTYFSISLDHRVVDGAIGAEFMNMFVKYIENPSLLLLEQI